MALTWTATAKIATNTALLTLIRDGSGTASFKIYTAGATLLATLAIDTATSAVNGTTGQLTLVPGAAESDAPAGGTASYAELVNENGVVLFSGLPCIQGTAAVANNLVLSSTEIVQHSTVTMVSATIG